jgi:hypothetical protein
MKRRLIVALLICVCASLARADFNPVALTPSSYTLDIVVPATTTEGLPYCINVTAGNGTGLGDNTYYEQGLRARPGQVGANSGIPPHNTVFTNINNANMTFLMPPDYTVNNELMVDSVFTCGTLTFTTPTTATNLAILCCGGGGSVSIAYTVTHADTSTETGTLSLPDWFAGGGTVAWGANGRVTSGGGYNNFNSSAVNNNAPYLYANQITVSGASPVASVALAYTSGQHGNFFAVSGNSTGAWTPIALNPSATFNVKGIVPNAIPFPVTGTMDQGTNLNFNGNLATWFERGFVRTVSGAGLPDGAFDSFSQPTHHYQFASFTGNNAILIDTNHQSANVTLASPVTYTAFALLTAGGNVGSIPMTNICILQHQDGVNETNVFLGFDWFDQNHNGAIALKANGRVNMAARSVNQVGNNFPYLFETYFLLNDISSPVTNIVVNYKSASSTSATTYIMAISASTGGIPPLVDSGPTPGSQTVVPGTNITMTVHVTGTGPNTGFWEVDSGGGNFVPLTDGVDANGSTISGSQTFTLSISNVFVADGTNYQFVAENPYGTNNSPIATLIVTPETVSITPLNPVVYTGNNVPLTASVTAGPPVSYQWFVIDTLAVSNTIPNATNSTYTVQNVNTSMNGYTYGVDISNIYGTNAATTVLNVADSAAFLSGDLSPISAEAYVGASVTYAVNAQGNSPITYQWTTNGTVVSGVNSNRLTLATLCGTTMVQVSFSNSLNGGVMVNSSVVQLQGDANPLNLGFNTNGIGWQTNGSVPSITNNVLVLTDGGGGEASSAFYTNAQYVGGAWNASFIYNSRAGGADGAAFILQTTNPAVVGGGGGQLGYNGIAGKSLAFEINLYPGNGQTIGIAFATNGATGVYQATSTNVNVAGTNEILVNMNWSTGVLAVTMTDLKTSRTYSTNYTFGSLVGVLGGNLAYIGFSGADGGVTAVQTVRNFQFSSVLPPVALSVSPVSGNSFVISWPNADPTYVLQTNSSLTTGSWGTTPPPVTVNGTNQVTVNVTGGSSQLFYRLLRVACP